MSCCMAACGCRSGSDVFGPSSQGCTSAPTLGPAPTCCLLPVCGRLRVVVLAMAPYSPIPTTAGPVAGSVLGPSCLGAAPTAAINAPPLTTITAGLPCEVALAGRPGAVLDPRPLPPAVVAALGPSAATAGITSLLFDFGTAGAYNRKCGQGSKEASGRVLALGRQGAVQASLLFTYRWCSPLTPCTSALAASACEPVPETVDAFKIDGCTAKGMIFTPVDVTTFLSTDPCTESLVILNLQQYCCQPDPSLPGGATPATITGCCIAPLAPIDVQPMLACASCPDTAWGPSST
jgi:hypothetical protein